MRFTTLALLASPILAFTIPEGQPQGVYSVSYIDGQEIHSLVRAIDPDESVSSPNITHSAKFRNFKRDWWYYCGGDALNHGDTDRANAEIDRECGNGNPIDPQKDFYSIFGCTVAYACNFADFTQYCSASVRQTTSAGITNQCGSYMSGWTGTSSSYQLGYGYEDFCKAPGNNFCGRGRSG